MLHKQRIKMFTLVLLVAALGFSGCVPLVQPPAAGEKAPTPVVQIEKGGVENPGVFVDPAEFRAALLQAIASSDTEKLQMWMTEPFLTGTWRADMSDTPPADALKELSAGELAHDATLALVKDADLKALMGGNDPLSIPRADAGVVDAFLVSGWGSDGRDEAVLFLSRQPDNSLKWQGWMRVKGGFSGARLGGAQPYQNDFHGYSLYVPKDYEISSPNAEEVMIMAPGDGHPGEGRAAAFIFVEPANDRTAEQAVEAVKAENGPGFNITVNTVLGIEDAQALVVSGIPGQDSNRQLFMVHNDRLFRILFVPDTPKVGMTYWQMEDLYAMLVNTFHFTQ